ELHRGFQRRGHVEPREVEGGGAVSRRWATPGAPTFQIVGQPAPHGQSSPGTRPDRAIRTRSITRWESRGLSKGEGSVSTGSPRSERTTAVTESRIAGRW